MNIDNFCRNENGVEIYQIEFKTKDQKPFRFLSKDKVVISLVIPQCSISMPRAGFEPATTRSSASPSVNFTNWVERSPRLSYLG